MKQLPLGVRLRTAAVFGNFHAGSNLEALEALRSPQSDPLWIWGANAAGKSHLLQAACADSPTPCAYVPLGDAGLPPGALEGLEGLSLICLDDVDRVAGSADWERALFALFNAAAEQRARLVFAARTAPTGASWKLPDWSSRAASCRVYQLRLLEDAERIEALRMRADARGLSLPLETAEYLLKRMPRNQQALFDLVDTLDEAALAAQRRLTVPFVRDALGLA